TNVSFTPSPFVSVALAAGHPSAGLPSSIARSALMNLVASTPFAFVGSLDTAAVTSNVLPTAIAEIAETMPLERPEPSFERKLSRHVPLGPVGGRPAPLTPVQHCPEQAPPNAPGGTLLPVPSERSFGEADDPGSASSGPGMLGLP